jgi:hypothetical protein
MKPYLFQNQLDRNLPFYWLTHGILTILFVQSLYLQPANAQGSDLDSLCQRSPLSARCKELSASQQSTSQEITSQETTSQQTTDAVQEKPQPQVIKFRLNDLSGVSEWIRAEVTGKQVKLLHTVVTQSGLSKLITSAAKLPIAIAHTWYDHPTSLITFQPDGCQQSACVIRGLDSITLPVGTDMYQGRFTLEYTESGWVRTITFKLPQQSVSSVEKTYKAKL